ncbi:Slp family lipoprotein [Aestuariibacter sp. A3R04]|uniref:Slp family lipoprotein n=1 Tax=Aestuariibacter sp. A3R04 TaxID=2841571 RepID=UPI001C08C281|nr:Slp family lipoprotein [Aestuariibacter sp. A3R04]MBU3023334.1 Slp family lipoprotein [Aestuariibacter sp. A3R04]
MLRSFVMLVTVVLMAGCSIIPDDIAVPEGTNLVSYNKAVTGGEMVRGQTARWGGVVVGVENKDDKTFVEVVNFPLNHYGRPNTREETIGRFKVEMDGFVDPINFEEGRAVTFVGKVKAPIAGMVGEQPYMYPRLAGSNFHFWRVNSVNFIHPMFFDYRLGWYSPYYYSFYRPYYSPFAFGAGLGPAYYYNNRVVRSYSRPIVSRGNVGVSQPTTHRPRAVISRPSASTPSPVAGGARTKIK